MAIQGREKQFGITFTDHRTKLTRSALALKTRTMEMALFRLWDTCRAHGLLTGSGVMQNAYEVLTRKDFAYSSAANIVKNHDYEAERDR